MTVHTNTRKHKQTTKHSNRNNNNDNVRCHTAAQQYGTQVTIVPMPNPSTTTQLVRAKWSNDGYQPCPARCAAADLISFYTTSTVD